MLRCLDLHHRYALLSSHIPIEEIAVIPSLSWAFVRSGMSMICSTKSGLMVILAHQIHFYSIPSLDVLPIKPIRHAIAFAVDDHHLKRPPPSAAHVIFVWLNGRESHCTLWKISYPTPGYAFRKNIRAQRNNFSSDKGSCTSSNQRRVTSQTGWKNAMHSW